MDEKEMVSSLQELCSVGFATDHGNGEFSLTEAGKDFVETVMLGHLEDPLEIYAAGRLQGLREADLAGTLEIHKRFDAVDLAKASYAALRAHGYAIVPVEPTKKIWQMMYSIQGQAQQSVERGPECWTPDEAWRRVLTAAEESGE